MLNELVMDLEIQTRGSPERMATETATRCAPSTMHMLSFSPPKSAAGEVACAPSVGDVTQASPAGVAPANQVTVQNLMGTTPFKGSADASQRSPACASRLGAAAAGGDASQRNPIGRLSLGVAVIGGDASQRSPPSRTNLNAEPRFGYACSPSKAVLQNCVAHPQGLAGNFCATANPDSPCSPPMEKTCQSIPAGCASTNLTVDGSAALKSWLSGAGGDGLVSDIDLAARLRAAEPESYED